MNVPQISSVHPMEGKKLLVNFINGVKKIYDCNQILRLDKFQLLDNEAFFKAVKVDLAGYWVSWNDNVDISEYELWINGVDVVLDSEQTTPSDYLPSK